MRVAKSMDFQYSADCPSIKARLEDISETGAFVDTTTTELVLVDCSGVIDDYETTVWTTEGYLRIDTLDAGSASGSFAGDPLSTTLAEQNTNVPAALEDRSQGMGNVGG